MGYICRECGKEYDSVQGITGHYIKAHPAGWAQLKKNGEKPYLSQEDANNISSQLDNEQKSDDTISKDDASTSDLIEQQLKEVEARKQNQSSVKGSSLNPSDVLTTNEMRWSMSNPLYIKVKPEYASKGRVSWVKKESAQNKMDMGYIPIRYKHTLMSALPEIMDGQSKITDESIVVKQGMVAMIIPTDLYNAINQSIREQSLSMREIEARYRGEVPEAVGSVSGDF